MNEMKRMTVLGLRLQKLGVTLQLLGLNEARDCSYQELREYKEELKDILEQLYPEEDAYGD